MEWFKIIAPLVGVTIGWGLSEKAKIWADKRQDLRKIRKLLFFLLELRFHFSRELNLQTSINQSLAKVAEKLSNEFGEEVKLGIEMYAPILIQILQDQNKESSQIEFLEKNIDDVIIELSEFLPVVAYELNGQHKIKERLSNTDQIFNSIDGLVDQMPFDLNDWFQPKLLKELLNTLDENILTIANMIDKKTTEIVKDKFILMDEHNDIEVESLLDDYIDKIKESIK